MTSKKLNATGEKVNDEKNGVIIESYFRLLLEVMNTFEVLEFKKHKCRECD
jgi:hypothetical protein